MFSTPEFQSWVKENAIPFASVMTRIEGRKDDALLSTYGFRGFPSMAILDAEGTKVTDKVGRDLYSMATVTEWAPKYKALDEAPSPDAAQWLMARLAMGEINYADAMAERAELKVSGDWAKQLDQMLFVEQMNGVMGRMRSRDGAPPKDELAAEIYEAYKAGKRLPEGASTMGLFNDLLVHAAKNEGDADAFFYSYEGVLAAKKESIATWEERLTSWRPDLEKYKDNERMLPRVQGAIERGEKAIVDTEAEIKSLEEAAAKMKKK